MKTPQKANWNVRRKVVTIITCTAAVATFPGSATATPTSTTTVSDVRALQLTSGGKAAVSYLVTHDISGHVDPGAPLAGARISRSQYPDVYAGVWGADYGGLRAWLIPPLDPAVFHGEFSPISRLIENTYFTDRLLTSPDASALEAGDRAQLAIADPIANAPLPWDRQVGAANGTLAWDYAVDYRQVSATYNGVNGTADAILIRADLVARGGDVDARAGQIPAPPLEIDLPRTYLNQQSNCFIAAIMAPYTSYVPGVHLEVLPETGKVVLTCFAQGYLYQAKEYTLPGGGEVKEWHIPIQAVILLTPDSGGPLTRHAAAILPQGGIVLANNGAQATQLQVPAGGTVSAGAGMPPQVRDSEGKIVTLAESTPSLGLPTVAAAGVNPQSNAASVPADNSPVLINELKEAAPINSSLAAPVDLLIGNKTYALTLDPDYRGEGVLALRMLRRAVTGTQYANALASPYVTIDGEPIKLTRDRLLDLRVLPVYRGPTLVFGAQTPPRTGYVEGTVFPFGLDIEAVYDLGNDRYAFLEFVAKPNLSTFVESDLIVRSINGEAVQAAPVQYAELPEVGPVTYVGAAQAQEFSGPLDINSATNKTLTIGNHVLAPSIVKSGVDGILSVLQAPAPLTPNPAPDPAKSIVGKPLAFYYAPPSGASTQVSIMNIDILSDGPAPVPNPGPIGLQCGTAEVADGPAPDAPPEQDIKSAWLDADDANLYATIQVSNVPDAAPAGSTYSWSLHWRYEHAGRYARATLDSAGQWSFDTGGYNQRFFPLNNVTGDIKPGIDGFIRIWIPRSILGYRNGELLRETSAHSWVDTNTAAVDSAPEGTNATYGSGGDFMVGPACSVIPPLSAVSRKTHASAGAFDINLPLTGNSGIECRSGGNHQIIVTFPTAITCNSARVSSGNGTVSSFTVDSDETRVVVNLSNVANAQRIVVTLNVSDGRNTGDVAIPMRLLSGDSNADGTVNSADISQTKSQSGAAVSSGNFREDLTVDGSINSADVSLAKSKSGTALP